MNKRDFISCIFVALGLVLLIGIETHCAFLIKVGRTIGFAPAPNPFNRLANSPLTSTNSLAYGCELGDGEIVWYSYDFKLRNHIEGPHRFNHVFLKLTIELRNILKNSSSKIGGLSPTHTAYLKAAWCEGGPLAKAAGCPVKASAIWVRLNASEAAQASSRVRVSCSN